MSSTDRATLTFKHPVSSQIMRDTWHGYSTLIFLDYNKHEDGNLAWKVSWKKPKKIYICIEVVWNVPSLSMQELPMWILLRIQVPELARLHFCNGREPAFERVGEFWYEDS